jgi:iron complex outermembrane recepter protein
VKQFISAFLLLIGVVISNAQTDTSAAKNLTEVEVSGIRNTYKNITALNVTDLSAEKMRSKGAFNISDGLTSVPGISQMNTGVAISKPVIRGLHGNRLQTVFSGLRFDNQQWQDEHGLGVSDIGIDHVEIIKGPASLLYGSEAVGGVINIVEEREPDDGKIVGDFNTKFLSNTLGNSTDLGFKGNKNDKNWRLRAGYESDADYQDGKNIRILNSRFNGYYFKASYEFKKKKWICKNNYNGSLNNFGFIMSDSKTDKNLDDRFSRTMDGPHHTVFLNILSSQNVVRLKNSAMRLNFGGQSNIRMEDEGGGEISLNMHLSSLVYNLQWIKMLTTKTELIISNQGLLQNNTNYGKRIIVPDANMSETGLSFFLNQKLGKLILEGGIGGNYRHIKTLESGDLNTPDKEIKPFERSLPSLNGMLGATVNPNDQLNIKLCGSTGFRSGNMAELASNGLHEGIFQYEIGNPDLKAEQNYNAELALNYSSEQFEFSIAGFNNYFNNYIYLAPTSETFYGITIFRYFQSTADLYGGEASISLKPNALKGFEFAANYATVTGILNDTSNLPFIPADKIHEEIKYTFNLNKTMSNFFISVSDDYVLAQNHPAVNETKTNAHNLFNAGIGTDLTFKNETIKVSLICNNILNENYYDHLSRFKAYGFHNIGRNFILSLQIPLNIK